MNTVDYDTDFYCWTQQQADLLRQGQLQAVDAEHLAEEIEDMGQSNRYTLQSYLCNVILHLLKWRHQPDRRGASWEGSIENGRHRIARLLKNSPSLKARLTEFVQDEYPQARRNAARETGLPLNIFPEICPFTVEQIIGDDWPE